MKTLRILILILIMLAVLGVNAQEVFQHTRLTKLWETTEGLKTTESVLHDPTANVLYVSCINENPWKKDENGYISKLSQEGKVISARWATGLSGPKGMGITQGRFYVTNIDEVVEIDLQTGSILKRYTHPRAVNLNDIAVSASGNVYVSDSKGDCLFQLIKGRLEVLSDSPDIKNSNGLYLENDILLFGQENRIGALNLKTLEVSTYIDNTGSIDGIGAAGINAYLFSDWMGHVYIASPGKEKTLLLDTTPQKINAADIGFDNSGGILYVPTFFHNGVAAYKLD